MTRTDGETFLTTRELAERWRMSIQTLNDERSQNRSRIPYIKTRGRILYKLSDVEKHERANTG